MTNVYAWPPITLTAWELTRQDPVSRSAELISGRSRTSSFQRGRRLATATVSGIGTDRNGAGYIENLKQFLDGGRHLVRVECASPIWALARAPLSLRNNIVQLLDGSDAVTITDSGDTVLLIDGEYSMSGVPTTDSGWPAISATGLPPNQIVARPSERITIKDADNNQEQLIVVTQAVSDSSGNATIRVFTTPTLSGALSIGEPESIVFEASDLPRSVQPAGGDWTYTWEFSEVFEDEYESWTELDPWS